MFHRAPSSGWLISLGRTGSGGVQHVLTGKDLCLWHHIFLQTLLVVLISEFKDTFLKTAV